jgi:alpha-L-fucosidase
MSNDTAALLAEAQHAMLGIKEDKSNYKRTTHPDAQWFGSAGLGLFVHWGISTVHGGVDLSWGMIANLTWGNAKPITPAEYWKLAERFQPEHYDPERWIAAAAKAGFRYAVLTTRHHDGYAMWPSKHGNFGTRTHMGGRDLVRPFVDACRRHGLKVGLYYSPPDWYYNRDYMSFNFPSPKLYALDPNAPDFDIHHQPAAILEKPDGWKETFRGYVRSQIVELLTRYAPVDMLWFDGGPPVMTIEEIRSYNPGIVVNPRMTGYGDFTTPECQMPDGPIEGWWELCEAMNKNGWGYVRNGGEDYQPLDHILSRLKQVRKWGGNYLINAAPRADGTMPEAYYERMAELAALGGFANLDAEWRVPPS